MSERVVGEIINPSDKCTIDTTDRQAACAAVLILGNGKYGLLASNISMPVQFYGYDALDWWIDTFDGGLSQYLESHRDDVSAALRTVAYVGERSSVNDIVAAAAFVAGKIERSALTGDATP